MAGIAAGTSKSVPSRGENGGAHQPVRRQWGLLAGAVAVHGGLAKPTRRAGGGRWVYGIRGAPGARGFDGRPVACQVGDRPDDGLLLYLGPARGVVAGATAEESVKRVLVLGGYGTFGTQVCRELARLRVPLTVAGRRLERAEAFAGSLGGDVRAVAVDITQRESCLK